MRDLKIYTAKNLLEFTSFIPIRGFNPPSILVIGKQLDLTKDILYNGIEVSQFFIQGPDRVIVRIPEGQIGRDLTDLKLLSTTIINSDSLIELSLARPIHNISGIQRLVQVWLLTFFTTPGSNVFSPSSGGGGNSLIGRTTDAAANSISGDLSLAVERTQTEILKSQAGNSAIPLTERLLSSSVASIQFDPESTILSARVIIQTMAGESTDLTIT